MYTFSSLFLFPSDLNVNILKTQSVNIGSEIQNMKMVDNIELTDTMMLKVLSVGFLILRKMQRRSVK
jgi:ribosomal protein S25